MIERENGTIRAIAWSEVFPWLRIARSFRLAVGVRSLILGAAGVLLTAIGWWLAGTIFSTNTPATDWLKPYAVCPWKAVTAMVPDEPTTLSRPELVESMGPLVGTWEELVQPATQGLQRTNADDFSLRTIACLLFCGVWSIAVWAFFGAAICRTAAVQLAADEQIGWGSALRFACRKWLSYCAAPLLPVAGVILATIPVLVLGWIMQADVGLLFGGVIWPLALVAGLLMSVLLIGVLFGWPLMWATISTEGTDSFDALSRSYAYLFQRPLHFVFYVVVAGFIGWLGWIFVQYFAAGVIWMGYWAAGWGAGSQRIDALTGRGGELVGIAHVGAVLMHYWTGCVKLLAVGYLYSYFWTAAAAIYLVLRRDVDATEMDEVFLDADQSEMTFGLPIVATDQAGAPVAEG